MNELENVKPRAIARREARQEVFRLMREKYNLSYEECALLSFRIMRESMDRIKETKYRRSTLYRGPLRSTIKGM